MARNRGYFVLVTGDRNWDNERLMRAVLSQYPAGTWLIHGDQRGADRMAGGMCEDLHLIEIKVPYIGYLGRSGGPARNRVMFDLWYAQARKKVLRVEAFHPDIQASKGTKNMLILSANVQIKQRLNGKKFDGRSLDYGR